MVNKRGWLRIIEASIAILIVAATILVMMNRQQPDIQRDISEIIPQLLEEIAENSTLRNKIITSDPNVNGELNRFIDQRIEYNEIKYAFEICEIDNPCYLRDYPSEEYDIFTAERIISSSLTQEEFKPKRLKIFLWIEK